MSLPSLTDSTVITGASQDPPTTNSSPNEDKDQDMTDDLNKENLHTRSLLEQLLGKDIISSSISNNGRLNESTLMSIISLKEEEEKVKYEKIKIENLNKTIDLIKLANQYGIRPDLIPILISNTNNNKSITEIEQLVKSEIDKLSPLSPTRQEQRSVDQPHANKLRKFVTPQSTPQSQQKFQFQHWLGPSSHRHSQSLQQDLKNEPMQGRRLSPVPLALTPSPIPRKYHSRSSSDTRMMPRMSNQDLRLQQQREWELQQQQQQQFYQSRQQQSHLQPPPYLYSARPMMTTSNYPEYYHPPGQPQPPTHQAMITPNHGPPPPQIPAGQHQLPIFYKQGQMVYISEQQFYQQQQLQQQQQQLHRLLPTQQGYHQISSPASSSSNPQFPPLEQYRTMYTTHPMPPPPPQMTNNNPNTEVSQNLKSPSKLKNKTDVSFMITTPSNPPK